MARLFWFWLSMMSRAAVFTVFRVSHAWVAIDYATGDSAPDGSIQGDQVSLVLNTNTKKFHLDSCPSVTEMKEEYRQEYTGSRTVLEAQGYAPCGRCKP